MQQQHDPGNIRTLMTALAWISLMVFVGFYFNDMLGKQHNPNQSLETQYSENRVREVTLQRNKYGHYVTSGKVNGQAVIFMLDTGATGVAIPRSHSTQAETKKRPCIPGANG